MKSSAGDSGSTASMPFHDDSDDKPALGLWRVYGAGDLESAFVRIDRRRVFGRQSGDVELLDVRASRPHAELEPDAEGGLLIRDLGSRNGTFVDEVRVESTRLPLGAVVSMGQTLFVVGVAPAARDAVIPSLVGKSHLMSNLRFWIDQYAGVSSPVLLCGESGVGKELAAHALHERGPRSGRPLIAVNIAAYPDALLESTLFGHVKGAFTGAVDNRRGLFDLADGGTLFLDEIADVPLHLQAKLLRAVEQGEVQVVGVGKPHKVDVRVIAATSTDLDAAMAAGRFRPDLYHRLSLSVGELPSLRSRREDILLLARHFGHEEGLELELDHETAALLLRLPWAGNVRMLQGCVKECSRRAGPRWRRTDIPRRVYATVQGSVGERGLDVPAVPPAAAAPVGDEVPGARLHGAIARAGGDLSKAARELGVSRGKLYRFLDREGLAPDSFRRHPTRRGKE